MESQTTRKSGRFENQTEPNSKILESSVLEIYALVFSFGVAVLIPCEAKLVKLALFHIVSSVAFAQIGFGNFNLCWPSKQPLVR